MLIYIAVVACYDSIRPIFMHEAGLFPFLLVSTAEVGPEVSFVALAQPRMLLVVGDGFFSLD